MFLSGCGAYDPPYLRPAFSIEALYGYSDPGNLLNTHHTLFAFSRSSGPCLQTSLSSCIAKPNKHHLVFSIAGCRMEPFPLTSKIKTSSRAIPEFPDWIMLV